MALNEDWKDKQEYEVDGKNKVFAKQKIRFGEYQTTSVKRSWTRGTSSRTGWTIGNPTDYYYENILSVEYTSKRQTIKFSMVDDKGDSSEVFCISRFNGRDLQIGKNPNSIRNIAAELFLHADDAESKYYVQVYTNKYSRPWELVLDNQASAATPRRYAGKITLDADNYYTIVPVTQMQGRNGQALKMPFGFVGFEIRNRQNQPVAAVSGLNKGAVYLSDLPQDERFLLANICTAILLQEHIE